jgi:hypothetical protein
LPPKPALRAARYESRAGLVGADHHDGAGVGRQDGLHRFVHGHGVALHRPQRSRLQLQRLERAHHAFQPCLAIAVVLVENADPLDADGGDLLDDGGRLVEVRRPHMEGVAVEGRAQGFGAGEGRDEGCFGGRGQRQGRQTGGRADVAEQRKHAALDQLLGVGGAAVGLVAVVEADQLDGAATNAAAGVEAVKVEQRAAFELFAQLAGRAAEGGRLPQDDVVALRP